MTIKEIRKRQTATDNTELQALIDSGQCWHLEGSIGRAAAAALEAGACFLPNKPHQDYWGNTVPARQQLQPGTKGTLENSINYYESEEL